MDLFKFFTKDERRLDYVDTAFINELYEFVKEEAAPNISQPEFVFESRVFFDSFYHYSDAIKCLRYSLKLPSMIMCRAAIDSILWKTTIHTHTNEAFPDYEVKGGRYEKDIWIKHGWKSLKKKCN